jgi:hypothetical protein
MAFGGRLADVQRARMAPHLPRRMSSKRPATVTPSTGERLPALLDPDPLGPERPARAQAGAFGMEQGTRRV